MFQVSIENKKGNKIDFYQNQDFAITSIMGLGPTDATINTVNVGTFDGERYNSSKTNKRNIVMTIAILNEIEKNRNALYNVIKSKEWIKFNYKNGLRDVFIEGYVESAPIDLFTERQELQVSILCPYPYFKNAEEIIEDMNLIINNFTFPFSIEEEGIPFSRFDELLEKVITNSGHIINGMIIELSATGTVTNPKIFNRDTREFFGLNITMLEGDLITISTVKGSKTVKLLREGVEYNIFNNIMKEITWLQLEPGDNIFTYEAETGAEYLSVLFKYTDNFEGV